MKDFLIGIAFYILLIIFGIALVEGSRHHHPSEQEIQQTWDNHIQDQIDEARSVASDEFASISVNDCDRTNQYTESCNRSISSCLSFNYCFDLVKIYTGKSTASEITKNELIQASKRYVNDQRQKLELPPI